jgi:hypothetical protein
LIEEKPEERRKRERKGEGGGEKVGEAEEGEISSQNVLSFQEAKDALPRHLEKYSVNDFILAAAPGPWLPKTQDDRGWDRKMHT